MNISKFCLICFAQKSLHRRKGRKEDIYIYIYNFGKKKTLRTDSKE